MLEKENDVYRISHNLFYLSCVRLHSESFRLQARSTSMQCQQMTNHLCFFCWCHIQHTCTMCIKLDYLDHFERKYILIFRWKITFSHFLISFTPFEQKLYQQMQTGIFEEKKLYVKIYSRICCSQSGKVTSKYTQNALKAFAFIQFSCITDNRRICHELVRQTVTSAPKKSTVQRIVDNLVCVCIYINSVLPVS